MVDRANSQAPADLRVKIFQSVQELHQFNDALLPDGARAIVQQEEAAAGAPNFTGQREYVYTRLPVPAAPALTFTTVAGVPGTPTRNAYLARSGALWIQWPQSFLVQLNAATPVPVADVITYAGAGSAPSLASLRWWRTGVTTTPGNVLFTISDNAISVVSEASDDGQIRLDYYARFFYPS